MTPLLGALEGLKGALATGAPTGRSFAAPMTHPLQTRRPADDTLPQLLVRGAALHHLEGLDVAVPLGRRVDGGHSMVAATGPEALAAISASHTGAALAPVLQCGRPATS